MRLLNRALRKYREIRCLLESGSPPEVDMERVHVILADSRSGSTLLQEHLDSHPENTELGEIFGKGRLVARDSSAARQIGYLRSMLATSRTPETGVKITFTQLIRNLEVVPFLAACKRSRFIVLERQNTVASAVSLLLAQATGTYHSRRSRDRRAKVRIDPTELKMLIETRNAYREIATRLLADLKVEVMTTSYEGLTADIAGTVGGVFSFLGLSRVPTVSDLKKVAPSRLADAIENYEEVRSYFAPFPEGKFLT